MATARGIFWDSELIVMEEPTNAIDPITEAEILKGFLKIAVDKIAVNKLLKEKGNTRGCFTPSVGGMSEPLDTQE